MSSTNRGAVRHADDYYVTPRWATWAVLPALARLGLLDAGRSILEPACGDGAILRVLRDARASVPLVGIELDEERASEARAHGFCVSTGDALGPDLWSSRSALPLGLAFTNPPFSLAVEFAQRGIKERVNTMLLLRLNFLGSADRVAFHKAHPAHIFTLGRRPSFGLNKDGKPGTDSCEYGWFGWGEAFTPNRWEPLDLEAVPAVDRLWEKRKRGKP
jgi:Methionine biosynthesis protein MetW